VAKNGVGFGAPNPQRKNRKKMINTPSSCVLSERSPSLDESEATLMSIQDNRDV